MNEIMESYNAVKRASDFEDIPQGNTGVVFGGSYRGMAEEGLNAAYFCAGLKLKIVVPIRASFIPNS
jgi:hypothetical protein